jgi:hypothetical protein
VNKSAEETTPALHDLIISTFKERFGEAVIGVKLTPAVHECWVTVLVRRRTPEMEDLANQLEQEFLEEYGKSLAFNVKEPWRAVIGNLVRKMRKI